MEKKLTKSDEYNLSQCPQGIWFNEYNVWPRVKRPRYSLDRLVTAGKLEAIHDYPNPPKYRVLTQKPN